MLIAARPRESDKCSVLNSALWVMACRIAPSPVPF